MDIIRSYKKEDPALHKTSVSAYCIKTGLTVCVSLLAYFFLMKSLGLHKHLVLRALNIVFLAGGLLIALNHFRNKKVSHKLEYFHGLRIGMQTTLWAVIPFAIFVGLYLGLDADFMAYLQDSINVGPNISPVGAAVGVAVEGISSGFLITYMAMAYYKRQ
jgi:hypothetical protein